MGGVAVVGVAVVGVAVATHTGSEDHVAYFVRSVVPHDE
jgi:hypothetical protein